MKPQAWIARVCAAAALLVASLLPPAPPLSPPQSGGDERGGGGLLPLRAAHAAAGSWTQTEWTTPNAALGVAPSGTNQYFRPSSVSSYGQLVGTFGVCAGAGAWCQGPGDTAGGQTLRLAGNHKSDAGNLYSSDLNGDGISELLFANWWNGSTYVFNGGWIYWGQGTLTSPSWSASQRTDLPTIGGHGAAVADLNGDGRPEVIFANFHNGSTYNVDSYIYWGQSGGPYGVQYNASERTGLPTHAAHSPIAADLNNDGRAEVIFVGGSTSYIYWGQAGGTNGVTYNPSVSTTLPSISAHGAAVADLNSDERPDVIIHNSSDSGSYIYWGQIGGPYGVTYSTIARSTLQHSGHYHGSVSAADLNNDNRPEIILASGNSFIYWGQAGGPYGVTHTLAMTTTLPGIAVAQKASVADINNDGQRDVVIQDYQGGFTRVFWGPLPTGGMATLSWTLPITFGFRGLSLSDLNSDGRVDLLTAQEGSVSQSFYKGGTSGRVYFHNGTGAPYNATPSFDLPVQSAAGVYASFGPGRGSSADWSGQPRPVYGTAFPTYGVLESMVMDSGQAGTAWQSAAANTSLAAGTGITLFVAASDNLSALNSPSWTQVGAMGNGSWTQSLSGVSGRYARYRVILWRNRTTEASPALQQITFNYETLPAQSGFNKQAPANAATGQPVNNLILQWTTVGDATGYQICYDTSLNGACNASWQGVGNVASYPISGLTSGTWYEWQVRACNSAGCNGGADNGVWWQFRTADPPGAFGKSTPANGATGQPTNPTLSWTPASGTVNHYRYCYATTTGCVPNISVGTATSVGLSGLAPGTTYYWQARACADAACDVFTNADGGAHWSFTTLPPVGSFNKLAPGNGAINVNTATAQLQWGNANNATEYRVCVGTAVNACNILGGGPGQYASVGLNQFRILSDLPLQANTTYYWQVLATNGVFTTYANGSALAFWSFTTLPNGPGNFNKVMPAFNATNVPTSNITFNWTPASGAVSYTVCVGAFAGDCSYSATSFGTSVVLPGPLPAGATLVWQVTAHNAAGTNNADSNAWWPLTTAPNAPQAFTKFAPSNGATGQPVGVNLTWQDVPDETYYQVCVGTSPGVCTFVNVTVTANATSYALTGLDYGTVYHWQISACNAGGCTPANNGVGWSFSTLNPPVPGPFGKTTPANGAIGVPTQTTAVLLAWTAAADADGYEVCLGTNPNTCDLSGGGFQDVGPFTSRLVSQLPFSVTLAAASTYYWQVRAYNNVTATRTLANNGVEFYFVTVGNPPGPGGFSKDAPLNGAFNLPTATLVLRWFPASGAASYEVCVGTAANSCNAMPGNAWLNVGTARVYTLTNLQPGTTYHWQVRAVNSGGTTAANGGAWWQFATRNPNPPAEFSKVSPVQWATGVPTATAVLSWYVSTGATAYEVCVGSAPGLCEASGGWVNVGNVTQWTVTPALNTATTYWWQVRALGSALSVQANGGQWWAFTTVSDPPPGPGGFSKQTPPQGASGQPTSALSLTWSAAPNAMGYEVCIGTQNNLCDVTGSWVNVGSGTSWAVNAALQPATTYWWQVRALNGSGVAQANDGAWWYFTTVGDPPGPGPFGKVAPANNAISQPLSLMLSWNAASGATGYEVCVGALPGDCSATGGWVSAGGTSHALSGLSYATTYFWQVKAVNAAGQTMADGGVWWRFTTENAPGSPIGAFGKVAPAHTATGVAVTGTLSWGAAANAARYTVCVGTQPGLCDVMNHVEVFSPTVSLTLANSQPGRTYWWQVFAYNDGNLRLADAGQWWAFSVANDPDVGPGDFGKTSPISGTTVANPVGLAWGTSSGAVGYRVCVGTAWGLCDAVNQVGAAAAPLTITLPAGSYWWQVTAVDADGDTTQADGGQWWPFGVEQAIGNLDNAGTRKEATPTLVRMGELVSYTIVLSNAGSAAVTARVTDTLAVSATLVGATLGYSQAGQTLVWSGVNVPAGGTVMLTVTVRAASGPLPGGYALANSVLIGTADGQIVRNAPSVTVEPWRAFLPIAVRPSP